MLHLILGHEAERRLAHGFRTQDLLVDRENLALDLDLDGSIAGEKQIRCLLVHHQLEQWLGVHHRRLQGSGRRHELEHLPFFFLDDLQRLSAVLDLLHFALAFQLDAQPQLVL